MATDSKQEGTEAPGPNPESSGTRAARVFDFGSGGAVSEEIEGILEEIQGTLGMPFVPAFFKVQTCSAAVLRGVWEAVKAILVGGVLRRDLKEAVIFAISASRNCEYCTSAHLAICRQLGMDEDQLETLEGPDRRILEFAVRCARNPQDISDELLDTMRSEGMSAEGLMELTALSGLAVMLNIVADITEVAVDSPIQSMLEGESHE